jgi:hypothetical protein
MLHQQLLKAFWVSRSSPDQVDYEPAVFVAYLTLVLSASEKGEVKLMDIRMAATALASAASAGAPIPGEHLGGCSRCMPLSNANEPSHCRVVSKIS